MLIETGYPQIFLTKHLDMMNRKVITLMVSKEPLPEAIASDVV